MSSLSQYKPQRRFVPTRTIAETLRVIQPGNLVSVQIEDGPFFAKVQSVEPTYLVLQILRHNFEPLNETRKVSLNKIISLKQVSLKNGIGTIKKAGSALSV
jgi:hypothetical protein